MAVLGWICLIFFTSTGQAGRWADAFFDYAWLGIATHLNVDGSWFPVFHFGAEKSVHVVVFTVLAMLMWEVVPPRLQSIGFFLFFGLLVGTCSELAQSLFPNRDPAIRDVLINMLASSMGATLSLLIDRIHATGSAHTPTADVVRANL